MYKIFYFFPPPPPPLDGVLVHRRVSPSIKFTSTNLYAWGERGTVRVKCLAKKRNTMNKTTLTPRPLEPRI